MMLQPWSAPAARMPSCRRRTSCETARPLNELPRPAQRGTSRRAEAFGETHAHRVEVRRVIALRDARRDRRIPQPRARDTSAIVGVLRAHEFREREMLIRRTKHGFHIRDREDATHAGQAATHHASQRGRRAGFIVVNVGVGIDEDFIAGFRNGGRAWPLDVNRAVEKTKLDECLAAQGAR